MSYLEPDLCSLVGSFMTHASLWWRLLEISGFDGRLLQRKVPGEGACLHAGVSDNFSPMPVFVWFLFGFFVCFSVHSLSLLCSIVTRLFVGIVARLAIFSLFRLCLNVNSGLNVVYIMFVCCLDSCFQSDFFWLRMYEVLYLYSL